MVQLSSAIAPSVAALGRPQRASSRPLRRGLVVRAKVRLGALLLIIPPHSGCQRHCH
jgi:hypothetical protein